MNIASWNVNSLKVRLPQVLDWLAAGDIDVLGLQETKTVDPDFPAEALAEAGYHAVWSGQKTYNGVALLARNSSVIDLLGGPEDVVTDLPGLDDPQRRVLAATYGDWRIVNLYVPNGQTVDSDKYAYKLEWLEKLHSFLKAQLARHDKVVVMGDFNIAPDDRDVHDPAEWEGKVLCSQAERDALRKILSLGFSDTFRCFDQPEASFSWWDYRAAGFRRNRGLRIDLVLASSAAQGLLTGALIDKEPRRWERPSDHTPTVAQFTVPL